ncbi:MAG: YcgN family cysteine cluster protein [Gammaproteobacteria bacterium]|nr:YcgN family cysteine cluster protein [Gammaproteobacteria bacterium]
MSTPFWQSKSLSEMSVKEWELLCDHCGRCCLQKLEDEDTGEIHYTNVVCDLLRQEDCRCTDYQNRASLVPDCVVLTPEILDTLHWMPSTCAYRLLWEGKPLPEWHPLVTGEEQTVHFAGISIRGRVYRHSEIKGEELQHYLVDWPQ